MFGGKMLSVIPGLLELQAGFWWPFAWRGLLAGSRGLVFRDNLPIKVYSHFSGGRWFSQEPSETPSWVPKWLLLPCSFLGALLTSMCPSSGSPKDRQDLPLSQFSYLCHHGHRKPLFSAPQNTLDREPGEAPVPLGRWWCHKAKQTRSRLWCNLTASCHFSSLHTLVNFSSIRKLTEKDATIAKMTKQ